jgi:hypothetical protein
VALRAYVQGNQKIEKKITQSLEKVAQTVAKPKNAKIFSSKLNLKVQNISELFTILTTNDALKLLNKLKM